MEARARFYKGRYLVTETGEVLSMDYRREGKIRHLPKYRGRVRCGGYYGVNINSRREYVHRIVATCFCPRRGEHDEVNHRDGDKLNNDWRNLEWTSHLRNVRHAYDTGLITREQIAANARHPHPTRRTIGTELAAEIKELLWDGFAGTRIARMLGISPGVVRSIQQDATFKDVPWPTRERGERMGIRECRAAAERYMESRGASRRAAGNGNEGKRGNTNGH